MTPDEIRLKNDAIVLGARADEIGLPAQSGEIRLKNDAIVLGARADEIGRLALTRFGR